MNRQVFPLLNKYAFVILVSILLIFTLSLITPSVSAGVATDSYGEAPAGTGAGGGGGASACNGPDDGDQPDCSDGPTASAAANPATPGGGGGGGGSTPATPPIKSKECSVVEGLGGDCANQDTGSGVTRFVVSLVRIMSLILGIIAIIFIIIAGFKYVVSGGNEQKVSEAKRTLIYAMIGLGVAALAQILVNFAFTLANKV